MGVDFVTSLLVLSVVLNAYLLRRKHNRLSLHANTRLFKILSATVIGIILVNLMLGLEYDFKLLSYSVLVLLSILVNCILILDSVNRPFPTGYRPTLKVLFYVTNLALISYTLKYIFA